jgi:hypothetical protein
VIGDVNASELIGFTIINAITEGGLLRVEFDTDEDEGEYPILVWSANSAEQIGTVVQRSLRVALIGMLQNLLASSIAECKTARDNVRLMRTALKSVQQGAPA